MIRILLFAVCVSLGGASASAESPEQESDDLLLLRKSGTYQRGLSYARELFDLAYDKGAVRGATHWKSIHEHYLGLAQAIGCKKGIPFADGPARACRKLESNEPSLLGAGYEAGKREVEQQSTQSIYPDLVRNVLLVVYDYGYVQGMRHGLRRHNADIVWGQTYYKSCLERANDAEHEPVCASASKGWSKALLERMRRELESHGLPARAGGKPK